ncbi:MAG TPA: hypothetical protein PLT63_01200 [Syntrophales bacterium]|nr:hypothetical protein [Syntrophales bacterium]HPL66183.1 hypothetical protein [Smithellaceae bacterium]
MSQTIVIEDSKFSHSLAGHFANVCWVCKAAAKEPDVRASIKQRIACREGILCATDGYRLHLYRQDSDSLPDSAIVPEGVWAIKSKTARVITLELAEDEFAADFPNFWIVFQDRPKVLGSFSSLGASGKGDYPYVFGEFLYRLNTHAGKAFRADHVADAFMPDRHIQVEAHAKGKMAVFGDDTLIAALMAIITTDNGGNRRWA